MKGVLHAIKSPLADSVFFRSVADLIAFPVECTLLHLARYVRLVAVLRSQALLLPHIF